MLDKQNQAEAKKDWWPHRDCQLVGGRSPPPFVGRLSSQERVRKRLSQGEEQRGERQRDVRGLFQRREGRKRVREKTDK